MFIHILKRYTYAYIVLHICAYYCIFMHSFLAYLSIILVPRPISLMNIQTVTCVRREHSFFHLLSLLLFLCFNSPLTPLNVPKVDDLFLGKVVASDVGKWKVLLQHAGDLVSSCLLYFMFLPNHSSASSL